MAMQQAHRALGALPRYADGGLINKIKAGLTTLVGNSPDAMAKRGRSEQIDPTPTPPPVQAGYASGIKTKDNPAGIKFAKGGEVKGKGTGTSDDIPIMASKGEFMVKAAAVKKLGVPLMKKLNAIADGDKAPVKAKPKLGAVPKMREGGSPEEERKRLIAQIPTGGTGTGPTAPNGNSVGDSFSSTELGRNVLNTASALGGVVPGVGGARALLGASKVGQSLGTAGKAVASTTQATAPYATPIGAFGALNAASQPESSNGLSQPSTALPGSRPAGALPQQPMAAPAAAPAPTVQPAAAPAPPLGQVTRVGNSYSGQNVSGDVSFVDGQGKARPAGGGFVGGTGDGTFTYGGTGGQSGNDQALQAARMAALQRGDIAAVRDSYGGNFGGRVAGDDAEQALMNNGRPMTARKLGAINKARADRAATAGAADERAFNRKKFGTETAGKSQDRKLARDKFDVDATGAKLDNESKQRLGALQTIIADPKATPEQRKSATEMFDALMGRTKVPARPLGYDFMPGGFDERGNPLPPIAGNRDTGEMKSGTASAQATPRAQYEGMKKGEKYIGADGKQYIKG